MQVQCSISGKCGGCTQIDVPYEDQLAAKQRCVEDLFETLILGSVPLSRSQMVSALDVHEADQLTPLADQVAQLPKSGTGEPSSLIRPILGMDDPRQYRTKIVSPFAPAPANRKRSLRSLARTGRAGKVALRREDILCGMYTAGTHQIVECENCPIEHPVGRRVVAAVRQIMARYGMAPYDEDAGTGFVRHVVVRVGAQSGEVLVTVVTNGREFTGAKNFCRELVRAVPEVTTIVQNVNTRQTNAIFGDEEQVLYGPGFILDTLCGLSFRISSHSFYQVNARQTEVLYTAALVQSGIVDADDPDSPSGTDVLRTPVILDAYCGTGTIGLVAAAVAQNAQVIGVDSVEAAIADARQNAAHNGIENARFVCQDAGEFMRGYAQLGEAADVLLMDPPRAGASTEFLEAALALGPNRIVYISCNPETQARDVRVLVEGGYRIGGIQPVDMFPHTAHIENIVMLHK